MLRAARSALEIHLGRAKRHIFHTTGVGKVSEGGSKQRLEDKTAESEEQRNKRWGMRDGGAVWHCDSGSPPKKVRCTQVFLIQLFPPPGFYRPVNSLHGEMIYVPRVFSPPGDGRRQLVEGHTQYCSSTPLFRSLVPHFLFTIQRDSVSLRANAAKWRRMIILSAIE